MQIEIEAKFLDVLFDDIRTRLTSLGATCEQPMRLMQRVVIDNEYMKIGKDAFLRVRNEGHRATMTYKQFDDLSIEGTKEIEVEVSDYDTTVALLEQVGLVAQTSQETKRENWRLGDVEIMLDEWPWLKPYIEIEGPSASAVQAVAEQLGFNWSDAAFGDVMAAYRAEYPHLGPKDTIATVPMVRFGDPLPPLLQP